MQTVQHYVAVLFSFFFWATGIKIGNCFLVQRKNKRKVAMATFKLFSVLQPQYFTHAILMKFRKFHCRL